jgi:hypothetical protein
VTNETPGSEYNHARHELRKLPDNADKYVVTISGRHHSGHDGGTTHGMSLTPEQYAEVKALLISFNL